MTALLLVATLQATCAPDCPTTQTHVQAVDHTQGKACPSCAAAIDVCFQLCAPCAVKKAACRGCGGKPVTPEKAWKPAEGGEAGIRMLPGRVVAITQGIVLDSLKARLVAVREFDDRVVVTYSTRTPQCGSEPRAFDALHVQLPKTPGKKVIVQHVQHSIPRGLKISTAAEFAPRD